MYEDKDHEEERCVKINSIIEKIENMNEAEFDKFILLVSREPNLRHLLTQQ